MRTALIAMVLTSTLPSTALADAVQDGVTKDMPSLLALYQELHAHPELSTKEDKSAAKLAAEARKLGFKVTTGVGGTGVVAVLANGPGPTVLIRTDMDALPVQEATGLPYASKVVMSDRSGKPVPVMHACGHDTHMSAWIGTARQLVAMKAQWSGTLVMIAQPAEEIGTGAQAMLRDGLYTRFPKPDYALALHDSASLPAGTIGIAPGYALANVDWAEIVVKGVGGHGAYPHLTKDPVVLASKIVLALQTLVSRETDPQEAAVVTVGSIHGGTKANIIPDEVTLQLTIRSYSPEVRHNLLAGIERVARGEAIAAGMPDDRLPVVTFGDGATPATFNTQPLTDQISDVFAKRFGSDRVVKVPPTMAGEDFSQYRLADPNVQSLIFWVGGVPKDQWVAAKGDTSKLPPLHSAHWAPDAPAVIQTGTEAMVSAALSLMGKRHS